MLDVVNRIHDENVLRDLLSDLDAPPNDLHQFFAAQLRAGGGHITANFDTCIERAASVTALGCGSGSFDEERQLLAETLARVVDHMSRYPDSRRYATDDLRRFALDHLPDPDELAEQGMPVGTHLRARLRSARRALGVATPD